MTRFIHFVVFLAGLAAVAWIGSGYVGTHPLALSITVLIGLVYLAGAWELFRFQRTTAALAQTLQGLQSRPESLSVWLAAVPAGLRQSVQRRVQGERAGLPGPTLAPYLVGLLVLLGMLGTFLGMVATLRGTGAALQSATDLQAIRASLAAPVMGLGFAFGTSVAGVASSAMLGLLLALCRRSRMAVVQQLDGAISTPLRDFSLAHQREERLRLLTHQADLMQRKADTFQQQSDVLQRQADALQRQSDALQRQSDALPKVVERLDAMMAAMTHHTQSLNDGLLASQNRFHTETEAAYARLADRLARTLQTGMANTTRAATAAIEPAVHATLDRLSREGAALQAHLADAVNQHLAGATARLDAAGADVAARWGEALVAQRAASEAVTLQFRTSLEGFSAGFEHRSGALLDGMTARLDDAVRSLAESWTAAVEQQKQGHDAVAQRHRVALAAVVDRFDQLAESMIGKVNDAQSALVQQVSREHAALVQRVGQDSAGLVQKVGQDSAGLVQKVSQDSAGLLQKVSQDSAALVQQVGQDTTALTQTVSAAHAALAQTVAASLQDATARIGTSAHDMVEGVGVQAARMSEQMDERVTALTGEVSVDISALSDLIGERVGSSVTALTEQVGNATAGMIDAVRQSEAQLRESFAAGDQARAQSWVQSLHALASHLHDTWEQSGERTAARQQAICDALARTAETIASDTQSHARATIAEIERLMQAASEAPRVAADVVIEVREQLSASMARDNSMLEERSRLLETLGSLLDAVNQASSEQRQAVDALVSTSAVMLARVGNQFTQQIDTETRKLTGIAGQVVSSAADVAGLSGAFAQAVATFEASNEKMLTQLQRVEASLDATATRSDEQLAYYVAQAREVVDLSILSQKQIVENLQRLAAPPAPATPPAGSPGVKSPSASAGRSDAS